MSKKRKKKTKSTTPVLKVETREELFKKLKTLCKTAPESCEVASEILLKKYFQTKQSTQVKENALLCTNFLFKRSSKFRYKLCSSFSILIDSIFLKIDTKKESQRNLETLARKLLREWYKDFGEFHPQINLVMVSQDIKAEEDEEEEIISPTELIQRNVDESRLEEIKRGFKIYDGAPLTGLREEGIATLLSLSFTKLSEIQTGLEILLPFLRETSALVKEVTGEDSAPIHTSTNEEENEEVNEEELEWESEEEEDNNEDEVQSGIWERIVMDATAYLPQNYKIELNLPSSTSTTTSSSYEELRDVKQALLDCRLTIENTLIHEIRSWAETLERVVANGNTNEKATLIRIKNLLKDLTNSVAQCERLGIRSLLKKKSKRLKSF